MVAETVDNTLILSISKDIRTELRQQRDLLLTSIDYMRKMEQRLDARLVAVRDDLELMLKSEIMGRLAHFETTAEQRLDVLEERHTLGE